MNFTPCVTSSEEESPLCASHVACNDLASAFARQHPHLGSKESHLLAGLSSSAGSRIL